MAIVNMNRVDYDDDAKVYHETVTLIDPQTESNYFLIPGGTVYSIGCYIDGGGAGTLDFTIDSKQTINDTPGSIIWESWDELSQVNKSVTAFRVTRSSGTVIAKVTVKTEGR